MKSPIGEYAMGSPMSGPRVNLEVGEGTGSNYQRRKIVVVMVGLPARGKTYVSRRICRYLNWLGIVTKVFNVGNYRRKMLGAEAMADFFDNDNAEALAQREKVAKATLDDMVHWLRTSKGRVAFFDATNTTLARRKWVYNELVEADLDSFFIENVCEDEAFIDRNIRAAKTSMPDYDNMSEEEAVKDFRARIEAYRRVYIPLSKENDSERSWMKVIDAGKNVEVHNSKTYLQSRIAYFCLNARLNPGQSFYFSRHGESLANVAGLVGCDTRLSPRGEEYALSLYKFMLKEGKTDIQVWTSTLKRTRQTAAYFPSECCTEWRALVEIDAGKCDGLTYKQIEEQWPEEYKMREENKFDFRYPMGESYRDVVQRLEPVIMELERRSNVLVVGHQAVLRCLMAYFQDVPNEELPYTKIPLHTVLKLTPNTYSCDVEYFSTNIPSVNTHRCKSASADPPAEDKK